MIDESSIRLLVIEPVAIVTDDTVRLVVQFPELPNEPRVVLAIPLEAFEVGEGYSVDLSLILPLIGKGKNIPGFLKID